MEVWVKKEVEECEFADQRLKTRLAKILSELGQRIGQKLPAACQDSASTQAAYRFFSNPRVDESVILAGHFAATRSRIAATKGPILILHDTTEFSYRRDTPQTIGKRHVTYCARKRPSMITVCGLLMHSSLASTPEGKPLGLTAMDRLEISSRSPPISSKRRISHYLMVVAKLGGSLARGHDPPPNNIWFFDGVSHDSLISTWDPNFMTNLCIIERS